MSASPGDGAGAEPVDSANWGLFSTWQNLIAARDPRFTLLAPAPEVEGPLTRLGATITSSMWNMQRHHTIHAMRTGGPIDEGMRRRGVELRFILPRRIVERRCPLASSYEPELRLAPVAHALMVSDRRWLVVGSSTGETVWISRDPGIVASAVGLYEQVWQAADPAVPEGEDPPFTRRMVDIAFLLVDGAADREIARALGVSERTVSADIREMSRRLGARSRAHAIAVISGARSMTSP
jgi:DNA-binding CsgD family transcriptional regulator